jgi:hypothetical protein
LAIEPGVDGGGGFEGGDADEDESPVEEEGDSELEDEGSEFSVGSSGSFKEKVLSDILTLVLKLEPTGFTFKP